MGNIAVLSGRRSRKLTLTAGVRRFKSGARDVRSPFQNTLRREGCTEEKSPRRCEGEKREIHESAKNAVEISANCLKLERVGGGGVLNRASLVSQGPRRNQYFTLVKKNVPSKQDFADEGKTEGLQSRLEAF